MYMTRGIMQKHIKIGNFEIGNDLPFTLIAGPCQIENREHAMMMAEKLVEITNKLNIPFVFKASFDKANRTSIKGPRGMGLEASLKVFRKIKETFKCPIITDVHKEEQCEIVASVADILQIPAFLCRQTDLIVAAAKTGKPLNIKKGQFLSPFEMVNVIEKAKESGNDNAMSCERGTTFGYNNLVVDMRGLYIMGKDGTPVIMDATHSVQQPGGLGSSSGGKREYVPYLAKAAVAIGVAGVFIETHDNPDTALSDGPNMVPLAELPKLLETLIKIDNITKEGKK